MDTLETVNATARHIETHLRTAPLNLDSVARAIGYSKYHLHRVFKAAVGLSIHDYVQRRRLTEAARALVFSEAPVIDIAVLAGYGSQQAFTVAFGSMYKQPPRQFRRRRAFYPLQLPYDFPTTLEAFDDGLDSPAVRVRPAGDADIPAWMELVRQTVDGFPGFHEGEHLGVLRRHIAASSAMLMLHRGLPIGALMVDRETAHIGFLAVHPLCRTQGGARNLLRMALPERLKTKMLTTTTFRAGDKADTGHRADLLRLGFIGADPLTEFGYPTQLMVLPRASLRV